MQVLLLAELNVSIHAPARGATSLNLLNLSDLVFQSTHPRGVRPIPIAIFTALKVSIHAPARGATLGLSNAT